MRGMRSSAEEKKSGQEKWNKRSEQDKWIREVDKRSGKRKWTREVNKRSGKKGGAPGLAAVARPGNLGRSGNRPAQPSTALCYPFPREANPSQSLDARSSVGDLADPDLPSAKPLHPCLVRPRAFTGGPAARAPGGRVTDRRLGAPAARHAIAGIPSGICLRHSVVC